VNLGPRAAGVLAGIKIDRSAQSDGLVRAALQAVAAIASANGHRTQVPAVQAAPSGSGGGGSDTALYVIAAVVVVLGIALIAVSVRTRRGS
jgi:hypothetical protein